jgi:hypothetical protein
MPEMSAERIREIRRLADGPTSDAAYYDAITTEDEQARHTATSILFLRAKQAPDLLAEVERLRERLKWLEENRECITDWLHFWSIDHALDPERVREFDVTQKLLARLREAERRGEE